MLHAGEFHFIFKLFCFILEFTNNKKRVMPFISLQTLKTHNVFNTVHDQLNFKS